MEYIFTSLGYIFKVSIYLIRIIQYNVLYPNNKQSKADHFISQGTNIIIPWSKTTIITSLLLLLKTLIIRKGAIYIEHTIKILVTHLLKACITLKPWTHLILIHEKFGLVIACRSKLENLWDNHFYLFSLNLSLLTESYKKFLWKLPKYLIHDMKHCLPKDKHLWNQE